MLPGHIVLDDFFPEVAALRAGIPMGEYRAQPDFRIPAAALVGAPFLVVTIAMDRLRRLIAPPPARS